VVRRGGVRWLREPDPEIRAEKVKELTELIKPAIKPTMASRGRQDVQARLLMTAISDATTSMTRAQQTRTDRLLQETGISIEELLIILQ